MIRWVFIGVFLWVTGAYAAKPPSEKSGPTDEEVRCDTLIAMVRAGTTAAFREFTEIVEDRLKRRIKYRGVPDFDVDDVVQDTYMMLLNQPQKAGDENSVIAYMMGLADTACKRHLGTNHDAALSIDPGDALSDVAADEVTEERSPLASWPAHETEVFHQGLFAKPERELLEMADRGVSLNDIKEKLGLPAQNGPLVWRIKTLRELRQLALDRLTQNLRIVFSRSELEDIGAHFSTGQTLRSEYLAKLVAEVVFTSSLAGSYPFPRSVMHTIRHHSFRPHIATALELKAGNPIITLVEIVNQGALPFGDNHLFRELPKWQADEQAAIQKAFGVIDLRFNREEGEMLRKFYAGASPTRLQAQHAEHLEVAEVAAMLEKLHSRFLTILREPGIVQPNAGNFVYTPEGNIVVRSGNRRGFESMFARWIEGELNRNFYQRAEAGEPLVDIGRAQTPVMTGQTVNKRVTRTRRTVDEKLADLDFRLSLAFTPDELHMLQLREQGTSAQRIYELRSPLFAQQDFPPLFEDLLQRLEHRFDSIANGEFDFASLPLPSNERDLLYAAEFSAREHYILYLDEWGFTAAEIVRSLRERGLAVTIFTEQLATLREHRDEALRRAVALPARIFSESEQQILRNGFLGNTPESQFERLRLHYRILLAAGAWSGLQLRPEREMNALMNGVFDEQEIKILELSDQGKPVRSILPLLGLKCNERALFRRLSLLYGLRDGAIEEGNTLLEELFPDSDAIRILELYWAKATLAEIITLMGYATTSETLGSRIDEYRAKLVSALRQRGRVDPRHPLYYFEGSNVPIPTHWGAQVEPYLTRVSEDDRQLFRLAGAGLSHDQIRELVPGLKVRFATLKAQRNQLSLIRGRITGEMTGEVPTKVSQLLSVPQLRIVLANTRGVVNERELDLLLLGDRRMDADQIRESLDVDWDDAYLWSRYVQVGRRAHARAVELKLIQP